MLERDVAVFSQLYPPAYRGGGPIRTLEALVENTRFPYRPWVIAADRDLGVVERLPVPRNRWVRRGAAYVHFTSTDSVKQYLSLVIKLREIKPRIVYVNSFFSPKFSIIPQLLSVFGVFGRAKVLVAPRGEMGPGALGIKSAKKQRYIKFYRKLGLHRRVYWHASSNKEANDIRSIFGMMVHVILKEDDTRLPQVADLPQVPEDYVRFVFVSRIVPIKGLDILLKAIRHLNSTSANICLDIYGVAEDAKYVEYCRKLAANISGSVRINWKGSLKPDQVRSVLAKYDYLTLPTKGENFGHIIAEALSVSVPVVCPDTTPWTPVVEAGGGHIVDSNEPKAWSDTLDHLASRSPGARAQEKNNAYQAYNRWADKRDPENIFNKLEKMIDTFR